MFVVNKGEIMKQNRWKSKVVWTSIGAIVALLMNNYGLWGYIGMNEEVFTHLTNMVLGVLVLVGVLNNPTDNENW
jgi:uncharacterized membrane protein